MGAMGPHAVAAIPVLTPGLKDQKADVRAATAVALGRIGPRAKAAVPALVQALKDDSPQVRQAAPPSGPRCLRSRRRFRQPPGPSLASSP
jgi:hypothetical protein